MKRLLLFPLVGTFFFFSAVSCQLEELSGPDKVLKELTITAGFEDDGFVAFEGDEISSETKTARLSDGSVWWTPGDAISVFYGSGSDGGSKFVNNATENASVARFSGSIGVITGGNESGVETTSFWGVYPYDKSVSCSDGSVSLTIPTEQQSAEGTFAVNQWPTIGKSQALAMSFKNIACGYKFMVQTEGITDIAIFATSGSLSGRVNVSMDSSGIPVTTPVTGSSYNGVVVTPQDGGTFKPGVYYYVVMIHDASYADGIKWVFYTRTSTAVYNCDVTGSKPEYPSGRGKFKVMNNKDAGLTWTPRTDVAQLPTGSDFCCALRNHSGATYSDLSMHLIADAIQFETEVTTPVSGAVNILNYQYDEDGEEISSTSYDSATMGPEIFVSYDSDNATIRVQTSAPSYVANTNSAWALSSLSVSEINGLDKIDFGNATDLTSLFNDSWSISSLDLSSMDLSNATTVRNMFNGCDNLSSIDLSGKDMAKVTDMLGMFYGCGKLSDLNLADTKFGAVQNFESAFENCSSLKSLDLSSLSSATADLNYKKMFSGCIELSEITLGNSLTLLGTLTEMFGVDQGSGKDYRTGCADPDGDGLFTYFNCNDLQWSQINTDALNFNDWPYYASCAEKEYAVLDGSAFAAEIASVAGSNTITEICFSVRNSAIGSSLPINSASPAIYASLSEGTMNVWTSADKFKLGANASGMFKNDSFSNITSISGLGFFDTSEVTDMHDMFSGLESLEELSVSSFNTSNVTDMNYMFYQCETLTSIVGHTSMDVSKVTDFSGMFNSCENLESVDISKWNMSSATALDYMFCWSGIKDLELPASFPYAKGEDMFSNMGNPSQNTNMAEPYAVIDCTDDVWTGVKSDMDNNNGSESYAWARGAYLTDAGSSVKAKLVTVAGSASNIKSVLFVTPATDGVSDSMFAEEGETRINTVCTPVFASYANGKITLRTSAKKFIFGASTCVNLFESLSALTKVDFGNVVETSAATSMKEMFSGCTALKTITGTDTFDSSNVTDMSGLFNGCNSIESLDLIWLDTSSATLMTNMFRGCSALKTLDLTSFNTSNVTDMETMFKECSLLTELDLQYWDVSKVTNMSSMFIDASKIADLYLNETFGLGGTYVFGINDVDLIGNDNSVPWTTFHCPAAQWTKIQSQIGNTYISNYAVDGPDMTLAYLPSGQLFNDKLKNLAGDLANIKTLKFQTGNSQTGTKINTMGDVPVYAKYSAGTVTVFTSAKSFKAANSCIAMFMGMTAMTTLSGLDEIDFTGTTDMLGMFNLCTSLAGSLDLRSMYTPALQDASHMFDGCFALEGIAFGSGFNTSKVTTMTAMFSGCESLANIGGLENFETSNVKSMESMFCNCNNLSQVIMTKASSSRLTNTATMFKNCYYLRKVIFGTEFSMSGVTSLTDMFSDTGKSNTQTAIGTVIFCKNDAAREKVYESMPEGNKRIVVPVNFGEMGWWSDRNIGAASPYEIGDYFAHGEAATKSSFTESNWNPQYEAGDENVKARVVSKQGDAAYVLWGSCWRLPKYYELDKYVSHEQWGEGGQYLRLIAENGNSINYPRTGVKKGSTVESSMLSYKKDYNYSYVRVNPTLGISCWHFYDFMGTSLGYYWVGIPVRPLLTCTPEEY